MPCLRLIVQSDNHQETIEFGQDEILVGRSTDGDLPGLILMDEAVSRKHARIWRALDGYWIEDLGSTHGTKKKGFPSWERKGFLPEIISSWVIQC